MEKKLLFISKKAINRLLPMLLLFYSIHVYSQSYKVVSSNLILNSRFGINTDNSTTVTNWTFNPTGDSSWGWKEDHTLIYGETLYIDRRGTYSAISNSMNLCLNQGKEVKFSFLSSDTGEYTMNVKLGGVLIGTLTNNGLFAQSKFTPVTGFNSTIYYNFWPEHNVNDNYVNNNIWHDFTIYIPNYTGTTAGSLTFEYTKTSPTLSRAVYIDNVEVKEVLTTPVPSQTSVNLSVCGGTYNLSALNPTPAATGVTYTWYNDVNHTSSVATPTAVTAGKYYLFAQSSCAGTTYSYPSAVVTVNNAPGCCGAELITNGGFQNPTAFGRLATGWTQGSGADRVDGNDYTTANNFLNGTPWVTPPLVGEYWMKLGTDTPATLSQTVTKSCAYDPKILEFDIVMDEESITYEHLTVSLNGIQLFQMEQYFQGPYQWRFNSLSSGITVSVKREDGTSYNNDQATSTTATMWQYDGSGKPWRYHIVVNIDGDTAKTIAAGGDLSFNASGSARWYLDNISLINKPPVAEKPKDINTSTAGIIDGLTSCPTGTFNLNTAEPNPKATAAHIYRWFTDAAGTIPVADPTKVGAGTYYMKTISTCSFCESTTVEPFVVTQTCPTVSGKVFLDYDGSLTNGISTSTAQGTNGRGLYAVLVSNTNVIISTVPVNADGTFTMIGTTSGTHVIINNTNPAVGSTLSTSTLNAPYQWTGDALNNTTAVLPADGVSPNFVLSTGGSQIVNFGIQSAPVVSDNSAGTCTVPTANTDYNINGTSGLFGNANVLSSVDDDPDWNGGVGQKLVFKSLNVVNGTLKYNGTDVTSSTVVTSYDPTLLVFRPNAATAQSSFYFTYVFEDKTGKQSLEPGTISYKFAVASISGNTNVNTIGGTTQLTGSAPNTYGTWTSSNTTVATVNSTGLVTGISNGLTNITYTNDLGCTATITISIGACYKPSPTTTGGLDSKHGITSLQRAGSNQQDNWPMSRKGAYTVLESNNKGFVINRLTTTQINKIENDGKGVEGMAVYDITVNCLKIHDGTSFKCYSTPTCDQ